MLAAATEGIKKCSRHYEINNMNIINNAKVSLHYSTHQSLQLNFPNKVSLCSEPKIKSLPISIKLRLSVILL